MNKLRYIVNLFLVALMLLVVAVNRNQTVLKIPVEDLLSSESKVELSHSVSEGGLSVLSSKGLCNMVGYGGFTPVSISVENDRIVSVELEDNFETESFIEQVKSTGLLDKWTGLTLEEAATADVEAVTGATMSSSAIIANVQAVARHAAEIEHEASRKNIFTAKNLAGLAVILFGLAMTFIKTKKKWLRIVQLVLKVGVLGFWCGSFLSLSLLVSWLAYGINFSVTLLSATLLIVAIVIPLFGKKSNYCTHHCPMGAAQELMYKAPIRKLKMAQKTTKYLGYLREVILLALLACLWLGFGFELMDYEIFSAFMISKASTVVLVMASVFLILSCFVARPYCRFVCPTGSLLKFSQSNK